MTINKNKIFYILLSLYASMYLGFFNNEDFVSGTIDDYKIHLAAADLMRVDIVGSILRYDSLKVKEGVIPHSPIYILYFTYMHDFFGNIVGRLVNMHFILLIPFFVYLSLKLKFNFNKNDIKNFLPLIFFISPYFRAGAIWMDDNVIGLTSLTISFYLYLKFENNKNKNLSLIFLHVLFLALASYFRPIYCIFAIYFFLNFYSKLKLTNKFFYYIVFNIILSAPAIYLIIVLDQNEWFRPWLFRTNNVTTYALALSVLFFYSIPFIFCNFNKLKLINFNKGILFFSIIYLIILVLNFNYTISYSGGFFYKLSQLLFLNNYFFYLISFLSFYFLLIFFKESKNKEHIYLDIILFMLLILMEIDGVIYHEAYDPLFYALSFLLVKNNFFYGVIRDLSFRSTSILFIFSISFFIISAFKIYI